MTTQPKGGDYIPPLPAAGVPSAVWPSTTRTAVADRPKVQIVGPAVDELVNGASSYLWDHGFEPWGMDEVAPGDLNTWCLLPGWSVDQVAKDMALDIASDYPQQETHFYLYDPSGHLIYIPVHVVLHELHDPYGVPAVENEALGLISGAAEPNYEEIGREFARISRDQATALEKQMLYGDGLGPVGPNEDRYIDPTTGGAKGTKDAQLSLVPTNPLYAVAEVFGWGAGKYSKDNWRKGYPHSKSYDAAMRHMMLHWSGEFIDPESGKPHLAHAIANLMILLEFQTIYPEGDDR